MRFGDLVATSLTSLWQRKVRTFLTVLGVMIGTISVVVMISLGLGLTKSLHDSIAAQGSLKEVLVQNNPFTQGSSKKLPRMDDRLAQTFATYEGVAHVIPVYRTYLPVKVGKYRGEFEVVAVPRESLGRMDLEIARGSAPGQHGLEVLVGHQVAEALRTANGRESFLDSGEDIVGQELTLEFFDHGSAEEQTSAPPRLKPLRSTVSGSIAGHGSYSETSTILVVELESLKQEMDKRNRGRALPEQPTDSQGRQKGTFTYSTLKVVAKDIKDTEGLLVRLKDEGYEAYALIEWIKESEKQLTQVQAIFGGIGAMSLLVAAIGIANTMMMSVYERTREIGVMKVLGASLRDIRFLFLVEAAGIGFIGGVLGILGSFLASAGLNSPAGAELLAPALGIGGVPGDTLTMSVIPPWLAGTTLLFATVIGTVAGLLPAHRATRLSALDAIRSQ
ncbi:ABC transporter permease [Arachnia propionica]|uniref:ABC transporter permease n=1 Tax=Arachnia propionica TaxID=1750 RepID=A0A3P1T377_9ACTN|nr:ABC transporter permease [Arachnia propionica]RRD03810.1 ABC transporter permease [Arachnia propionica]